MLESDEIIFSVGWYIVVDHLYIDWKLLFKTSFLTKNNKNCFATKLLGAILTVSSPM